MLKRIEQIKNQANLFSNNLYFVYQITLKISVIGRIPLRDFKGLEKCDGITRKMVLDFSLNVALGNMDQAFRYINSTVLIC